jgi:hypothetical protein
MRRRRKEPRQSVTQVARAIYRAAYGEAMPRGWRVEWVGFMRGARGMCFYDAKRILLSRADLLPKRQRVDVLAPYFHDGDDRCHEFIGYAYALDQYTANGDVIRTLVHEFTHLRNAPTRTRKGLRHGADFERLVDAAVRRVWEAAR